MANMNHLQRLIKSLQWAEKQGATNVNIEPTSNGHVEIYGLLPDGTKVWVRPMSQMEKKEEWDAKYANKVSKPIPVVKRDHERPSDGLDMPDGASDAYDRYMGYSRDMYESIQEIKGQFKRLL